MHAQYRLYKQELIVSSQIAILGTDIAALLNHDTINAEFR